MRLHLLACLALMGSPLAAQEVLARYVAVIGTDDLYNSEGERLTEPWQVLRQDRADYHRFDIRQEGDEWDPLFADAKAREAMERLVMAGHVDGASARAILSGGAVVRVTVGGKGGVPDWVDIEVIR